MKCTSPLYRLTDTFYKSRGDMPPSLYNKRFYNFFDYEFAVKNSYFPEIAFQKIGCGQCLSCRVKKAKEWSERCYLESLYHDSNYFVTLTYDDEHLPFNGMYPTLKKEDYQLFMKRLRKALDYKVSYFASGEYGTTTFRPHMHSIIFGLKLNDLEVYKVKKSYLYYNSEFLNKVWGKGHVVIGIVNNLTCAYTASYSLKKLKTPKIIDTFYDNLFDDLPYQLKFLNDNEKNILSGNIEAPFMLCSKRPAIGKRYFDEHVEDILANDNIFDSELQSIRYFDKLIERIDPSILKEFKMERESRVQASNNLELNVEDLITEARRAEKRLARKVII